MVNRRSSDRAKTFLGARIEQPQPFGTMDCIVRDLSMTGARLEFHNTATVMNRFDLVIPRKDRRLAARIVWRSFGEAGVAFDAPGGAEGKADLAAPLSMAEKLRASELRRRELEARVAGLNEGV